MKELKEFRREKIMARVDLLDEQKRMFIAGFNTRYLDVKRAQIIPSHLNSVTKKRSVSITKAEQEQWINDAIKNLRPTLKTDMVVGIAGDPTDDVAMACAALICREAMKHQDLRVRVHDAQDPAGMVKTKDADGRWRLPMYDLDALVLHNILYECTDERVQTVRDMIKRYEGCLRLVVIAGGDPVKFFLDVLRVPIDAALYFKGGFKTKQTL
jgi:hypothetical protein